MTSSAAMDVMCRQQFGGVKTRHRQNLTQRIAAAVRLRTWLRTDVDEVRAAAKNLLLLKISDTLPTPGQLQKSFYFVTFFSRLAVVFQRGP
jgi:hypothetical protein